MRIFHPRPQPGRQKFIGVDFRDGVATVDVLHPERRLALEQHGYAIQDDDGSVTIPAGWAGPLPEALNRPDVDSVDLPAVLPPLSELTVAELREIARFEGIDLPAKVKKADIVEALVSADRAKSVQVDETVTITIDGESFAVSAERWLTPHMVLELAGLNPVGREARVLGPADAPEEFDAAKASQGREFITFQTSAGN